MGRFLLTLVLLLVSTATLAQLQVVATTANMGMLARAVGGTAVKVTVLAPPNRDVHYLEARPNMLVAVRRADLLVAVGAELEVGWLPAVLQGAQNAAVQVGRPGYFEGAAAIELMASGQTADRAGGDVHPAGHPHYYLDPVRMGQVGEALARRLAQLQPDQSERFHANARAFQAAVAERLPGWREQAKASGGVVLFHKDADYLMDRLGVPVLGYLEPLPGIPPTARHLRELVQRLGAHAGVIVHTPFQPRRGPDFLQRELGWPVHQLALNVPLNGDWPEYFALIDAWVGALSP